MYILKNFVSTDLGLKLNQYLAQAVYELVMACAWDAKDEYSDGISVTAIRMLDCGFLDLDTVVDLPVGEQGDKELIIIEELLTNAYLQVVRNEYAALELLVENYIKLKPIVVTGKPNGIYLFCTE